MRIAALVAAALLTGLAAVAPAHAQERAPDPIPVEEWSQARVIAMGQAIFRRDQAAAVATDALLAHLNGRQPPAGLAGWIVVDQGPDLLVRFVRLEADSVRPAFDIPVRNGRAGAVSPVETGTLSATELAQFRARTTAASNIGRLRCSRQLNAVVLDDPDSDEWLVWLLTATTDANVVPMGGHYRFRISADGSTVIRRDMLTNSCLSLRKADADGRQVVALSMSQIVSSGPVETHVFLSLQNRMPIFVAAGDGLFEVNGAAIRDVRR
ncbi:hypothetical protein [Brevundimonas sp. FT23028]|uniref:hypothetical protein n=1 Tax=Brevundimonas sp. FT23028 TaxID=3393748 RepID=UPI003B587C34